MSDTSHRSPPTPTLADQINELIVEVTILRESIVTAAEWDNTARMERQKLLDTALTSTRTWLREEKRWERVPLKNRKRRTIPVDDDLLDELKKLRVQQKRSCAMERTTRIMAWCSVPAEARRTARAT